MEELATLGQAPDLNLNLNLAESCNCCNGSFCCFNIFRRCVCARKGAQTLVYDEKTNALSRRSISRISAQELSQQCKLTLRAFILAEEAQHGTALYHVGCMVAGIDLDNRLEKYEGERRSVDWRAAFPDTSELAAIETGVEDTREWAPAAARLWRHRIQRALGFKSDGEKLIVTWPRRTPRNHKLTKRMTGALNEQFTLRALNRMRRHKFLTVKQFAVLVQLVKELELEEEPFEDELQLHRILGKKRCQAMDEMGKLKAWQTARKESADQGVQEGSTHDS